MKTMHVQSFSIISASLYIYIYIVNRPVRTGCRAGPVRITNDRKAISGRTLEFDHLIRAGVTTMRPTPMDYFADLEEQSSRVAMEVDDVDPLEMFGEGVLSGDSKLADADFFNSFGDDFDDTDIH